MREHVLPLTLPSPPLGERDLKDPLTLPSPPRGERDQKESLSLGEGEGWVRVAHSRTERARR